MIEQIKNIQNEKDDSYSNGQEIRGTASLLSTGSHVLALAC